MLEQITWVLREIRSKAPLIQCITNYVTINDCANILLCSGASPAMAEAEDEAAEFASLADALYLNIGTLTQEQYRAMILASTRMTSLNKPIVLDPVAYGAISRKTAICEELFTRSQISIIKGNIGEIKSMAGYAGKVRGVDSIDEGKDAPDACRILASRYNTVVVATGKRDFISDGERVLAVDNGHPLLAAITGSGCMVGALTAAAAAVCDDMLLAGAAALVAIGLASEMAANSLEKPAPGSFRIKLFDSLYSLKDEDVLRGGKISWI